MLCAFSFLASFAQVGFAETVQWIGSTAGDWADTANWSTGALPTPADDVVVNLSSPVFVTHSSDDTQIASLTLSGTLHLSGGSITVTQPSQITGNLIIDLGAALITSGVGASFTVTNSAFINGGSVIALDGGTVVLLETTQHSGSGLLSAQGAGSRIAANLTPIPPPSPPNLLDAVSRSVSVYQGDVPCCVPDIELLEAVSRSLSVYHGPADGNGEPAEDLTDAVSRAVSVYHGLFDGDSPAADLLEAVSRSVSVYQGPADGDGDPAADLLESVSRPVSVRHE